MADTLSKPKLIHDHLGYSKSMGVGSFYYQILRLLKNEQIPPFLSSTFRSILTLFLHLPLRSVDKFLIRQLQDALLPHPYLHALKVNPKIGVLICCTKKDRENLPLVINQLSENSLNHISEINIISPEKIDLDEEKHWPKLNFFSDLEILNDQNQREIQQHSPCDRFNWILQQSLKLKFTLMYSGDDLLVLDADTYLIRPHLFLDQDKKQILSNSYEYHQPYNSHANSFFNIENTSKSYVTHFQLWQVSIIKQMFPKNLVSILEWIRHGQANEQSPISEFHSYGSWVTNFYPDRIRISSWRNTSFPPNPSISFQEIRNICEGKLGPLNSISIHNYRKD